MKNKPLKTIIEPGAENAAVTTTIFGRDGTKRVRTATEQEIERLEKRKTEQNAPKNSFFVLELTHPADQLFMELGGIVEVKTVPVKVGSQELYVRKLDAALHQQFAAWTARDGQAALDFANADTIHGFFAALLYVCVTIDPLGEVPYFTPQRAAMWARSTSDPICNALDALAAEAIRLNPRLVAPQDFELSESEKAAAQEAEKKSG